MINKYPTSNNQKGKHPFDLEERTFKLGKEVLGFAGKLPQTNVMRPVVDQFIRSGTSIGANYSEANEANSKKDFLNKIAISKKEAKETQYWLKLIAEFVPLQKDKAKELLKEVQELNLIFAAIIRNSRDSSYV